MSRSSTKIDYRALDLKVGLEIHVQLDSKRKLFCECPPVIRNDPPHFRIVRRLRPTLSELGEVDPAALWEFRKRRVYIYEGYYDTTCLVELDEEPPHDPDPYSLETAILVAKMFNAKVFDELYVMRKIVIDGSNVSGFQRTILVAHDGLADFFGYKVPIWTIALEEDAARKIEETEQYVVYRLDRLGIPLIEISTGPLSYSPQEIAEIAAYIGYSIKLTGRAKRGIGTVRQDLNVSIRGGAKTEIKGVPDLSLIPKVIEYEVLRQLNLLRIRDELLNRGVKSEDITPDVIDVTDVFTNTRSGIIRKVVEQGGKVLALRLPEGFRGLLGFEVQPGRRFGTELADYVRAWTWLKGIIHSDELPGYGITRDEVAKIEEKLGGKPFILIAGVSEQDLSDAVDVLVKRLRYALVGVPEETRAANPDGTTRFMRPRPGSARMYPETDLRPVITIEIVKRVENVQVETIDRRVERYVSLGTSRELALQIVKTPYADLADRLIEKYRDAVNPSVILSTFTTILKSLQKEGVDISKLTEEIFDELFSLLARGIIVKEAIPDILKECAKSGAKPSEVVEKLGLRRLSFEEVLERVRQIVEKSGVRDENKLLGMCMRELRGKAEVEDVRRAIRTVLSVVSQGGC